MGAGWSCGRVGGKLMGRARQQRQERVGAVEQPGSCPSWRLVVGDRIGVTWATCHLINSVKLTGNAGLACDVGGATSAVRPVTGVYRVATQGQPQAHG